MAQTVPTIILNAPAPLSTGATIGPGIALPIIQKSQSLWDHAVNTVPETEISLVNFQNPEKRGILEDVLVLAQQRREECLRKRWRIRRKNGTIIILRDVFEKMIVWINKFKEVGDIAVQYDPTHASLPWAGIRMILQLTINDSSIFGAMLQGVDTIAKMITRYAIFEGIYLVSQILTPAENQLAQSLTRLYASILVFLGKALHYYSKNTAMRLAKSAVSFSDNNIDDLLKEVYAAENFVSQDAQLVDADRQQAMASIIKHTESIAININQNQNYPMLDNAFQTQMQQLTSALLGLEQPILRMSGLLVDWQDQLDTTHRSGVLNWISNVPYMHHHRAVCKGRLQDTGLWLLEKPVFSDWQTTSYSSILWLHGIPGSGKTKLISLVVDDLIAQGEKVSSPAPIAYFYCARNQMEPERADPEHILCSIARQLVCKSVDYPIHHSALNKHKEYVQDSPQPLKLSIDDAIELILAVLDETPATIVIDALDEADATRRHELLDGLETIIQKSINVVKIFVSSRDEVDIVWRLEHSPNLYVHAADNSDDIERFVMTEVDLAIRSRRLLGGQVSDLLQDLIITRLANEAHGMFRWVTLQLQNLCDSHRIKCEEDLLQELGRLPRSLADTYDMIYNQIVQSGARSKTIGERVLKWLLATQRPLKINELQAAVSVDDGGQHSPLSKRDILAMTCNLVVEDTELGIFRYAHTSVLEYLETRPEFDASQVNMLLLSRCMDTLLHLSSFQHSQCTGDWGTCPDERFKDYASSFWLQHCVSCSDHDRQQGVSSKIKAFLFNGLQKTIALSDWENGIHYWSLCQQGGSVEWIVSLLYRESGRGLGNPTHWFLTCAIGLTEIIEQMSLAEINALNKNLRFSAFDGEINFELQQTKGLGMNGLHMAIIGSNEATVEVLLRKGLSISERTDSNETCLSLATTCNNPVVVELLCSAGADPNESCPVKMKDAIGTINQTHLDPESREFDRRPQTAMGFRQQTRTVLIDEDIETPLHSASFYGNDLTVTALLKWGADINARSWLGSTVLHKAMEGDHQHVAILLIKAGADASTPLMYGRTPLHLAAAMGQDKLAECLIQHGANALARDHFGKTPQEIARRYGHHSIVQILEVAVLAIPADEIPGSSYMLGATLEEFEAAEREELELRQAYLGENELEVSDTEENTEYSLLRSEYKVASGEDTDEESE
ncbi:uncharacterized protein N7496_006638 [Penicillium cataractarum]|uniref:NACHT domain-containing protein n=1 Tax=Penicillium cataractarum TaxID=2100454 RepID=A0A9W9S1Y4_9EURO|nr:uncharacterized protein N7496_006638 [Penicillium cataractarum]KAJ5370546.1 hypothetical protein N7496_006638 [Penicillium cataractarum]